MPHVHVNRKKTSLLALAVLLASVAAGPIALAADKAGEKAPEGKTTTTKTTTTTKSSAKGDAASVKRVTADKMKMYTEAIANAQTKNNTIKEQISKLRQQVKDMMVAPTFDKAAFVAKSNEIETLDTQIHKNLTEATAAALTRFTPEERQILARGAKAGGSKDGKKGKKGKSSKEEKSDKGAGKAKKSKGNAKAAKGGSKKGKKSK